MPVPIVPIIRKIDYRESHYLDSILQSSLSSFSVQDTCAIPLSFVHHQYTNRPLTFRYIHEGTSRFSVSFPFISYSWVDRVRDSEVLRRNGVVGLNQPSCIESRHNCSVTVFLRNFPRYPPFYIPSFHCLTPIIFILSTSLIPTTTVPHFHQNPLPHSLRHPRRRATRSMLRALCRRRDTLW